jgi:hypothetical protein
VTDRVPAAAAVGFQANAAAYERSRPSYPPEAVAHIVGHAGLVWNTRDRGVAWVRAFGDLLVDDRVRTLARTHPDLAGRDRFGFPHRTAVHRCRAR